MLHLKTIYQLADLFAAYVLFFRAQSGYVNLLRVFELLHLEQALMNFAGLVHVVFEIGDTQRVELLNAFSDQR